jgi:type VI secretion system protein
LQAKKWHSHMAENRLLERLSQYEKGSASRTGYGSYQEIQSIVSHLRKLLNTRVGSAQIGDDYGIPDLASVVGTEYSQTITELRQKIQQVITKYEPRLRNVRIMIELDKDDVLSLRFKAEGFVVGGENLPIVFETVISTDGKVDIAD